MLWLFILSLGALVPSLEYSRAVFSFFKGCFAPGERAPSVPRGLIPGNLQPQPAPIGFSEKDVKIQMRSLEPTEPPHRAVLWTYLSCPLMAEMGTNQPEKQSRLGRSRLFARMVHPVAVGSSVTQFARVEA